MSNRKPKTRSNVKNIEDQCTDMRNFIQSTTSNETPQETSFHPPDHNQSLNFDQNEFHQQRENEQINTEDFMKLFQVDRLINPKYGGNNKNPYTVDHNEKVSQLPIDQLVEMTLLFKLSHEMDFIRHLNVSEYGRKLTKQIDLCLETLKNLVDMSPDQFKVSLNNLVQKQKQLCGH